MNRPRALIDELFSPMKYLNYSNEMIEGEGTKDKPFVIRRKKLVESKYHGWYDDDGSYHETLVKED